MNISKFIAKFVLASFVFSSVMQGVVLAIPGKTETQRSTGPIRSTVKGTNGGKNVPTNLSKEQKAPTAPENKEKTVSEQQTPEQPILKSSAAIAQTKELLTKLLATVKTDISSLKGQAVNLYNGSLGSVQFTKEGALNMLAKVTPESTLGKAGVVAVIVTGGIVFYYIRKNGMPGAEIVKVVAGKVGNYVTLPSAATVVKGAAVLGVVSLAAAGLYAYKTGNVRPLANVAYPVVGIPTLYAAGKLASYAKNLATSGMNAVTSGTKTVASKVVKTAESYTPDFMKSAGSTFVSAAKSVGLGAKSVLSYPFVGSKKREQNKANAIVSKQEISVNEYSFLISYYAKQNWTSIHPQRKRACGEVYKDRAISAINKLQGSYSKEELIHKVNTFFLSTEGNDRQERAQAIVNFLTPKQETSKGIFSSLNPFSCFSKN